MASYVKVTLPQIYDEVKLLHEKLDGINASCGFTRKVAYGALSVSCACVGWLIAHLMRGAA